MFTIHVVNLGTGRQGDATESSGRIRIYVCTPHVASLPCTLGRTTTVTAWGCRGGGGGEGGGVIPRGWPAVLLATWGSRRRHRGNFRHKKEEPWLRYFSCLKVLPWSMFTLPWWVVNPLTHYTAHWADTHLSFNSSSSLHFLRPWLLAVFNLLSGYYTCPILPQPPCPRDVTEGKRLINLYQSSRVVEVSGNPCHLTRTWGFAALPFFTSRRSRITLGIRCSWEKSFNTGSLENAGLMGGVLLELGDRRTSDGCGCPAAAPGGKAHVL
jgi:hypothetical protein